MNKLKTLLLFISFGITASNLIAQEAPLKLSATLKPDNSYEFSCEKADPGNYTVVLTFKDLKNTFSPPQVILNAKGYGGNIYTLKPQDKDSRASYGSYSSRSIRGELNPKYETDFVYVLPYAAGTKVRVAESGHANSKYFGSIPPDDWKVYAFYTENEQLVTAARKGVVVSIKDLYATKPGVEYTSQLNEVIIEHKDGTLATYRGFKQGSIKVEIGQTVFPGTPLGLNTTRSSDAYLISLSVMYLKSADFQETTLKKGGSFYGFVTSKYHTKESGSTILEKTQYTSETTPEIVQKEMTKKELKQLGKS